MRRAFILILPTVCLAAASAQQGAAPNDKHQEIAHVRVGTKAIAIPSPAGDLMEPGPDYRVLLEPLAPVSNRLVAAFVTQSKLENIHAGSLPAMDEYALVEVPRRAEFADVDEANFKQVSDALSQQFGGDLSSSIKNSEEDIDQKLKSLGNGSTTVTMSEPLKLGAFFTKPNAAGFGMIMPYNVNGTTTRVAMAVAVLRVRNRVLFSYTFATYKDEGSVKWIRATSEQWADAILKSNQ
jgi:hypothetical protein